MQTPLMATREGHSPSPESEMVVISTDDPRLAVLILDDGERISFDHGELAAALTPARPQAVAA